MRSYGRLLLLVGALWAIPVWFAPHVHAVAPESGLAAADLQPANQSRPDPDQAEDQSDDESGSPSDPLLKTFHAIDSASAVALPHHPDVSYVHHHARTLGSLLPTRTAPADPRGPPAS